MIKEELNRSIDIFIGYFTSLKQRITEQNAYLFEISSELKNASTENNFDLFNLTIKENRQLDDIVVRVSGRCFSCNFVHDKTLTTIFVRNGERTRVAKCVNCGKELPYRIEGCTCSCNPNVADSEIIIGNCPTHQYLK